MTRANLTRHRMELLESRRLLSGQIQGSVFNDYNANGVRDAGEPGVQDWTVYLDDNLNDKLDAGETSTTTAGDGTYSFTGAGSAARYMAVQRPDGWRETSPSPGRLFIDRTGSADRDFFELDPRTGAQLNRWRIPVGTQLSSAQGAALGPDGLFFADGVSSTRCDLYQLNPDNGLALRSYPSLTTTGFVAGAAYLNGLLYLDLAAPANQIIVYNPAAGSVVRTMSVPANIGTGFAAAADLNVLLATDSSSPFNKIHVIDPLTGAELRTLTTAVSFLGGGLAYVNEAILAPSLLTFNPVAYRIDPLTGSVLSSIPLPSGDSLVAMAGDGSSQCRADLTGDQDAVGMDFGVVQVTPAPIAVDLLASSDTGTADYDNYTSLVSGSTVFRVYGTVPGATVTLYNAIASARYNPWGSAIATGNVTDVVLSIPPGYPGGSFTYGEPISAIQRGANMLPSTFAPGLWVKTGSVPAPAAPMLLASSDTGVSATDGLTADDTPTFVGNANDGEIVRLYADGIEVGSAVAVDGLYTITASPLLPRSSYYSMTTRIWHGSYQFPQSTFSQRVTIRTAVPTVLSAVYAYTAAKPALNVTFSSSVWGSLTVDDFHIVNLGTAQTVPISSLSFSYSPSALKATVAFPGYPPGVLPDGNYRLTLAAGNVADDAGPALAADYTFDFFALAGDANRDRIVDISDLGILATNWQGSGKTFAQGDFNYDGIVDISDLGILATNWQKSLAAPSRPAEGLRRASTGVPSIVESPAQPLRPAGLQTSTTSVRRLVWDTDESPRLAGIG